jgi:hypothetical protein
MKTLIAVFLVAATPVLAYTDGNGWHPPGECDIWTTTCKTDVGQKVGVTAYGQRREFDVDRGDPGTPRTDSVRACRDNPYIVKDPSLLETCIRSNEEAAERLRQRGIPAE